jgi:hypothetical protein
VPDAGTKKNEGLSDFAAFALVSAGAYLAFAGVFIAALAGAKGGGSASAWLRAMDYLTAGFGILLALACAAVVVAFIVMGFKQEAASAVLAAFLAGLALIMPVVRILETAFRSGFAFPYGPAFLIALGAVFALFLAIDIGIAMMKRGGGAGRAAAVPPLALPWAFSSAFFSVSFSALYLLYMRTNHDPWWGKTLVSIVDVPIAIAVAVLPCVGLSAILGDPKAPEPDRAKGAGATSP